MEKSTLQIAEQVGLFLLPVVRGIVATMFTKAQADVDARWTAHMVELRTAGETYSRDYDALQDLVATLEKRVEQATAFQNDIQGAVQSRASADALDALAAEVRSLPEQIAAAKASLLGHFEKVSTLATENRSAVEVLGAGVAEMRETLLQRIGEVAEAAVPMLTVENTVRGAVSSARAVLDPQVQALQNNVVELQQELITASRQFGVLQVSVASIGEKSAAQAEGTLDAMQKIESGLSEVRTVAESAAAGLTTLQGDVSRVGEELLRVEANVSSAIEADRTRAAASAEQVAGELRALEERTVGEMRAVQNSVEAARVQVGDLRQVVATKEDDVYKALDKIEKEVAGFEQQVSSTLEELPKIFDTREAALRATIDRLADTVSQRHAEALAHADEAVAAVPSVASEEVAEQFRSMIEHEMDAALPVVQRNLTATMRGEIATAVAALPKPKDGADGVLPVAEPHIPGELYKRGAVVLQGGGMWQALRRTRAAPGAAVGDWQALAVGVAGLGLTAADDARTVELAVTLSDGSSTVSKIAMPVPVYRDVYSPDRVYEKHDIVSHEGLWIARTEDTAGVAPGTDPDRWKLIVKRGERGRPGSDGKSLPPTTTQVRGVGFEGEYEEGRLYEKDSIVGYASSLWMSKRPTKDRPPYLTNEDNEHWLRLR